MKKNILTLLMVCAAMIGFVVAGCSSPGSSDSSAASNASIAAVFGVASLDTTANGTVSMTDSSVPAQEKTAAINSNGDYTVEVSGLKPPFMLKAEGTDQSGNGQTLYSVSKNGGRANINPISDTAVAASADNTGPSVLSSIRSSESEDEHHRTADKFESVINRLRTELAPLYSLYNISGNAVYGDDDDENDNSGLRAMLRDVQFVVKDRKVTVTNRQTSEIIFSGSLRDLASGTFYAENMPAGPGGATACAYTYDAWSACQSNGTQTRNMLTTSPAGCTGTPVLSQPCTYTPPTPVACNYTYGAWGACLSNGTQVRGLVSSSPAGCTGTPALTQNCTPPPAACTTYNYSAWGACVNNTQTRTVASLSPANCVGTPTAASILSQACTSPVACTTYNYSAWGACVNNTQTRTVASLSPANCVGTPTAASILSQACTSPVACTTYNYSAWGACVNNTQTRTVASLSPANCVGTPAAASILSQACTSPVACTTYNYSAWGACVNNTQTRTVASLSPANCVGTPAAASILSQACTSPVACTTYNYSAWGACVNNTQTRTVASLSPANCVGTPAAASILSQACTSPTPVCGSCHAIPPSTGHHSFHYPSRATCSTCHGTGYSPTAVTAATHQNGVVNTVSSLNFNATTKSCSPSCHGSKSW